MQILLFLQKIDDNGDGAISFDEWLAFVINKYKGGHDIYHYDHRHLNHDIFDKDDLHII